MSARTETIKSTVYGIVTDTDSGLDVQTFNTKAEQGAAIIDFVNAYLDRDDVPCNSLDDALAIWDLMTDDIIDNFTTFKHEVK